MSIDDWVWGIPGGALCILVFWVFFEWLRAVLS
jgi:hypothetical protein